jgi:hypothetical protein
MPAWHANVAQPPDRHGDAAAWECRRIPIPRSDGTPYAAASPCRRGPMLGHPNPHSPLQPHPPAWYLIHQHIYLNYHLGKGDVQLHALRIANGGADTPFLASFFLLAASRRLPIPGSTGRKAIGVLAEILYNPNNTYDVM